MRRPSGTNGHCLIQTQPTNHIRVPEAPMPLTNHIWAPEGRAEGAPGPNSWECLLTHCSRTDPLLGISVGRNTACLDRRPPALPGTESRPTLAVWFSLSHKSCMVSSRRPLVTSTGSRLSSANDVSARAGRFHQHNKVPCSSPSESHNG
jgi:hypothetical protein